MPFLKCLFFSLYKYFRKIFKEEIFTFSAHPKNPLKLPIICVLDLEFTNPLSQKMGFLSVFNLEKSWNRSVDRCVLVFLFFVIFFIFKIEKP
jgi:hypothetical protein